MIINAKCLNCHIPKSVNNSAKKKLQWVEVSNYDLGEQRKFIKRMYKVIRKDKMPPKKTLKQFPELELTKVESNRLLNWLDKEAERIEDN